jgi:hypothetical protein
MFASDRVTAGIPRCARDDQAGYRQSVMPSCRRGIPAWSTRRPARFRPVHWPAGHSPLSRNLTGIVEAQVDAVAAHPHVILSVAKDPGF